MVDTLRINYIQILNKGDHNYEYYEVGKTESE